VVVPLLLFGINTLIVFYIVGETNPSCSDAGSAETSCSLEELCELSASCSRNIAIAPSILALNVQALLETSFSKAAIHAKVVKFETLSQNIIDILRLTPILSDDSLFCAADAEILASLSSKSMTYETCILAMNLLTIFSLHRISGRPVNKVADIFLKLLFTVLKISPICMKSHKAPSNKRLRSLDQRLEDMRGSLDATASYLESKFLLDPDNHNNGRKSAADAVDTIYNLEYKDSPSKENSRLSLFTSTGTVLKEMKSTYADYVHNGLVDGLPLDDIFNRISSLQSYFKIIKASYTKDKVHHLLYSYDQRFFAAFITACLDWTHGYANYIVDGGHTSQNSPPGWLGATIIEKKAFLSLFKCSPRAGACAVSNLPLGGSKWHLLRCVMIFLCDSNPMRIAEIEQQCISRIESHLNLILLQESRSSATMTVPMLSILMSWEYLVSLWSHCLINNSDRIIDGMSFFCRAINKLNERESTRILSCIFTAGLGYVLVHQPRTIYQQQYFNGELVAFFCSVFGSESLLLMHPIVASILSTLVLPQLGIFLADEDLLEALIAQLDSKINDSKVFSKNDFASVDLSQLLGKLSESLSASLSSIITQWISIAEVSTESRARNHSLMDCSNMHNLSYEDVKRFLRSYLKKYTRHHRSAVPTITTSKPSKPTSIALNELPIDIVSDVFLRFLSSKRLCRLASTCRFYRELIHHRSQSTWQALFHHRYPECIAYYQGRASDWRLAYRDRYLVSCKLKYLNELETNYQPRQCPYLGCRVIFRRKAMEEVSIYKHSCTESVYL
jgi:hypothetical protein